MAEALPVSQIGSSNPLSTSSQSNNMEQLVVDVVSNEDNLFDPSQVSPGPTILDFSYTGLDSIGFCEALSNQPDAVFDSVESILATNNSILEIPDAISRYKNLRLLDLSSNQISDFSDSLTLCHNLVTLIARNNLLDENSFPKHLKCLVRLKELNLSGNRLTRIPYEILELPSIQILHLGANRIVSRIHHKGHFFNEKIRSVIFGRQYNYRVTLRNWRVKKFASYGLVR
ncbi:leucine-rich repeat-containing protein 58-like [Folsomia candida]|uniref:leucine-rich repeat-containing protein 58-like n=1 Tax=Folsomia candida TaxID=158441 RepID=UPI001604C520|nr:leucine-rich repeat-containing protein 58-like [Folsomia candida]